MRPTWISIASSTVVAFSAGNLWAIAQRGASGAEAEPRLQRQQLGLVDDAVDIESSAGALLLDLGIDGQRRIHRLAAPHQRIDRKAPVRKSCDDADWVSAGGALDSAQAWAKNRSGREAVTFGIVLTQRPAALLRGLT